MSLRQSSRAATLAGLVLPPTTDRLAACAFHTRLPEASLTDDTAGSREVIAARPSAVDPFRFEAVELQRGEESGQSPPDIVDSVTRARPLRNRDEELLYARTADGTWMRVLLLDAATQHYCSYLQHGMPDGPGCINQQNTSPHPQLIRIRCQAAEIYSATIRLSNRFHGHFVSGIHKLILGLPGNSQPSGRASRHQARSSSSKPGDSMTLRSF